MPRDGSGVFDNLPGINATPNTTIESADWNNYIADIKNDLNAARPIIAGGTGSGTVAGAQANLQIVPTTGGTLTGDLTISKATPGIHFAKTAGNGAYVFGYTASSLRWRIDVGDSAPESGSNAGSNFSINSFSDAAASLGTPFYINRANGRVGINQTTPTQTLDVGGVIQTSASAATYNGIILANTDASGRNYQWLVGGASSQQPGALFLLDNTASAFRICVKSDGNVGIGTTTPTTKLEVAGEVLSFDGTVRVFMTAASGAGGYIGTRTNDYFSIRTNNVDVMRFHANGNVGIGTTTPDQKLVVSGNIVAAAITSTVGQFYFNAAQDRYLYYDGVSYRFPTADLVTGGNVIVEKTTATVHLKATSGYPTVKFDMAGVVQAFIEDNGGSINVMSNAAGTAGMYIAHGGSSWTAISDARFTYKRLARDITADLPSLEGFRVYENTVNGRVEVFGKAQEINEIFPQLVIPGTGDDSVEPKGLGDPLAWGLTYDRMGLLALGYLANLLPRIQALEELMSQRR